MLRAMYSGATGLKSYQTGLDVTANNLSNVNTVGYKAKTVDFEEVLYQETAKATGPTETKMGTNPHSVGLGVRVGSAQSTIALSGSTQRTEYIWDMRINGDTFFIEHNNNGDFYTRDGAFGLDWHGDLVGRNTGNYVYGWTSGDGSTINYDNPIGILHLLDADPAQLAIATSAARIEGNINNRDPEMFAAEGNPVSLEIYDTKGAKYKLTFSFKDADTSTNSASFSLLSVTGPDGTELAAPANTYLLNYSDRGGFMDTNGDTSGNLTIQLPAGINDANAITLNVKNTTLIPRDDKPVTFSGGLPDWVSIDAESDANKFMSTTYNADGQEHVASFIDFANFGPGTKAELVGSGVYFTCCTCENYYSIEFVSGAENTMKEEGPYHIYQIGVDDVTTGEELIDKILAFTNANPNEHFTRLAREGSSLVVYDERPYPEIDANKDYGVIGRGVAHFKDTDSISDFKGLRGDANGGGKGTNGDFRDYVVQKNGMIYGIDREGTQVLLGQIAVAKFKNMQGLASAGDNMYTETLNSGAPDVIQVTEDDGEIISGALEMSNVSVSDEMASLIVLQRAFQANSRVISTSDEMLQTVRDLKR